jgi:hypothetical protein
LPVQKTPTVGAPGRGICSILSIYIILMVPSSAIIAAIGGEHSPSDAFSYSRP